MHYPSSIILIKLMILLSSISMPAQDQIQAPDEAPPAAAATPSSEPAPQAPAQPAPVPPIHAAAPEKPKRWWDALDTSDYIALMAALAASATFIITCKQTRILSRTARLQAATTHLSLVKFQLETILRGSAIPLGQQALSIGYDDHPDRIQERKNYIISQICGSDETLDKQAWVTTLVDQWFDLEKTLLS